MSEAGASPPDAGRPPNILLLITDQQRAPQHWPEEPGWLAQLMPNEAELRAHRADVQQRLHRDTAMCSPSRATLFTGRYPAGHGVTLTLTDGDLQPDPAQLPGVLATMAATCAAARGARAPRPRASSPRARCGSGRRAATSRELPRRRWRTSATMLREAGYTVAYKGKWHLTTPLGGGLALGRGRRAPRLERDYGFAGWEAPDAGENAKAEHFGGGNAGRRGQGWDEDYTRQAERWLARATLPEPFCLVVSLVNPHDVLGYPPPTRRGGYRRERVRRPRRPAAADDRRGPARQARASTR